MSELDTTKICEALVRHVETSGSEVFEKSFIQGGKVVCTVWCVVGDGAGEFKKVSEEWLGTNGYKLDQ
jgi:hypothetical protein